MRLYLITLTVFLGMEVGVFAQTPGAAAAAQGKEVFVSKGCANCHGPDAGNQITGNPVDEWRDIEDPAALAARMWNHAGDMQRKLERHLEPWPRLNARELADLIAYVRTVPRWKPDRAVPIPKAPAPGAKLFRRLGCAGCHTGDLALDRRFRNRTPLEFAAAMWNHAPSMMESARRVSVEEMRELLAYLVSIQAVSPPSVVASADSARMGPAD